MCSVPFQSPCSCSYSWQFWLFPQRFRPPIADAGPCSPEPITLSGSGRWDERVCGPCLESVFGVSVLLGRAIRLPLEL